MKVNDERQLFILIDDDPINNSVSRLMITNTMPAVDVITFSDPTIGLGFLKDHFKMHSAKSTVLLLNLNMPFMTGWDFLEHFKQLDPATRNRMVIYILTSSIDDLDRRRALAIGYVKGFLSKPLSPEKVLEL